MPGDPPGVELARQLLAIVGSPSGLMISSDEPPPSAAVGQGATSSNVKSCRVSPSGPAADPLAAVAQVRRRVSDPRHVQAIAVYRLEHGRIAGDDDSLARVQINAVPNVYGVVAN